MAFWKGFRRRVREVWSGGARLAFEAAEEEL
jgi:hypothetical protein